MERELRDSADAGVAPVDDEVRVRQQIAEEHAALREILGRIQGTRELAPLRPLLAELGRLLRQHFAREEAADGLHPMVEESAPHLLPNVQRLFDEHRELAARLESLEEKARQLWEGPLTEVFAEAGELARRLHEHEVAEGELLAGAMYEDLGFSS